MSLEGRRVLVTGAEGFIGSHLAEELVRRGASVRALFLYNAMGSRGWLDDLDPAVRGELEIVPGDVRDAERMQALARGCDLVFHLAALIAIPYSYLAPRSYVETNVLGTLNVLQAARDGGAVRVVHTSTSEVYGRARTFPILEDEPVVAASPYAASKIGADQLALSFHRAYGFPVTVLRPFNTYGPRQSARAVIPTVITQLASGVRELRLGNVETTRDFSFVKDVVAAFLAAGTSEGAVGEIIHSGTGHEISVAETAQLIAKRMGKEATLVRDDERVRPDASEVHRLLAGTDKARRLLGWTPEYGGPEGFRRGLDETIDWFLQPAHLARYRPQDYAI